MRIAILGGPGSGKGTQAQLLAKKYHIPQISTGDLLRSAMKDNKEIGKQIKKNMDGGQLVPNDIVLKLLEQRLDQKDTKRGFIIDGYPRNIPQAQTLDNLLGILGKALQVAVYIKVDDDVLVRRTSGREICDGCDAVYNRFFYPAQKKGFCDQCGSKLVLRDDDNAESVRVRIGIYHQETMPLITYYRAQHKLRTIEGDNSVEVLHDKLCSLIDVEVRPLEINTLEITSGLGDEEQSTVIAGGQVNRLTIDKPEKKVLKMEAASVTKKPVRKKMAKKKVVEKTVDDDAVTQKKTTKKTTKKKAVAKPVAKVTKKKATKKKVAKKVAKKKSIKKKAVVKPVAKPAKKKTTKKKVAKKTVSKKQVAKKKTTKKKIAKKKVIQTKVTKKKAISKKKIAKKRTVTKKTAKKKTARKKVTKKK